MRCDEIILFLSSYLRATARMMPFLLVIMLFGTAFGAIMLFLEDISPKSLAKPDKVRVAFRGDVEPVRKAFETSEFVIIDDDTSSIKSLVASKKVHAVIEGPAGFTHSLQPDRPEGGAGVQVLVHYDAGDVSSGTAIASVESALETQRDRIRNEHVARAGLADRWQITVSSSNTAENKEAPRTDKLYFVAKSLSMWMTLFVTWLVIAQAIGMLVDEHQKGTFVLLILSPTSKASFVVADFIYCCLSTMIVVYPCYLVLAFLLNLKLTPVDSPGFEMLFALPGPGLWLCLLFSLPMLFFCSALGVLISTFTRDMKQVGIISGITAGLSGMMAANVYGSHNPFGIWLGLSPVSGSARSMCDAILGASDWQLVCISFASAAVYAFIFLALAAARVNSGVVLDKVVTAQ